MKRYKYWIVQCTWGILQTFIGALIFMCLLNRMKNCSCHRRAIVVNIDNVKFKGGLSLGLFVFAFNDETESTRLHEEGHSIQSMILGPLYLFVIGLPSLIWAGCFKNWRRRHNINYYSFYTESWANSLVNKGKK